MRPVIKILLSNAIKFSYPHSLITVEAGRENGFEKISVIARGTGIAPENLDKLFRIEEKYSTMGTADELENSLGLILAKE